MLAAGVEALISRALPTWFIEWTTSTESIERSGADAGAPLPFDNSSIDAM